MGWPLEIPENENHKWLCLIPLWSGFRDEDSTISIQIDYSRVLLNEKRLQNNRMLIQEEKIVAVQSFDVEVFQQVNSAPPDTTPLTQP